MSYRFFQKSKLQLKPIVNKNKIIRWLTRNALLLISVILFGLSIYFYFDVEARRSQKQNTARDEASTSSNTLKLQQ
jgi:heme/copper-type cytochrome/quinol oxidase subunit 2